MQAVWQGVSEKLKIGRDKLSTLGKFAIFSAIPIVLFGLLLSYLLNGFVYERTLEEAKAQAELVAGVGPVQDVTNKELHEPNNSARWQVLETALRKTPLGRVGSTFNVWNSDLQIVYSSDTSVLGHTSYDPKFLDDAFDGETQAFTTTPDDGEDLLSLMTPLHAANDPRPIGVLELTVPYKPVAHEIKQDFRLFYVVLLVGLNLLYAGLFVVMLKSSHRLRRRAEEQEHLALHDVLTGLPNRALFRDRVKQALRVADREKQTVAVMLMDLDRFKEINDTLGHHHGDIVLQETARRLKSALRDTDTISRLGGDEFAIVIPNVPDPATIVLVAEKIRSALSVPFIVQGLSLDVGVSIGVAFFPGHGKDVDTLIQRADVAMYLAKTAQSGCEIYAEERDQYTPSRLALVGELRQAIDNEEFVVYYQPKVDLKSGEVRGVEALIRWDHPLRKMIGPNEFIPLAEHTGLIEPLTMYVLNETLKQAKEWRDAGHDLKVAVNLSARSVLDGDFPNKVSELLRKWHVPPSSLAFEITESMILTDPKQAAATLSAFNRMGIEISIDDFGTGYSSLVNLRSLPLTELKIDRSFVANMGIDENDAVIVRSLIDLARNLGLNVVAEGVETEETWTELNSLGCDYAQGFFNSPPMPADQLIRWLHVMSQPVVS